MINYIHMFHCSLPETLTKTISVHICIVLFEHSAEYSYYTVTLHNDNQLWRAGVQTP